MHPRHVHISYASPRVKSRGAFSEEKKQDVREKNADQQRTARAGYSEEKKQDVLEKNNDQHRTAMSAVATIASWLPTVLEVARLAYIAQRNSWDSLWLTELPARATPEFQFKERFLVS